MVATTQGTPTTLKDAMMRSDWAEVLSRLAQSKSVHPVIEKSTPNILPIFKSLPRTKSSFFKNAKKRRTQCGVRVCETFSFPG
jgi:hypothetical protein